MEAAATNDKRLPQENLKISVRRKQLGPLAPHLLRCLDRKPNRRLKMHAFVTEIRKGSASMRRQVHTLAPTPAAAAAPPPE